MTRYLRVKETSGTSYWFLLKKEGEILGFPVIFGHKVDRTCDGDFTKIWMIGTELIESMKPARKISEFTCGHRSVEMVEGKCPKCFEGKSGNFMDECLEVVS